MKKRPRTVVCKLSIGWLVAWHSGRTSVCDQRTFPFLSTLDLQLMGDHLCGQTVRYKVSQLGQLGQLSLSSFRGR